MKTTLITQFLKSGNAHRLDVTCNASGTMFTATLRWDNALSWDHQIFQTAQGGTFIDAMEALETIMALRDGVSVPPTQAVDLEQFREAVEGALYDTELRLGSCYHEGRQKHVDKLERMKRLLALINGQSK